MAGNVPRYRSQTYARPSLNPEVEEFSSIKGHLGGNVGEGMMMRKSGQGVRKRRNSPTGDS